TNSQSHTLEAFLLTLFITIINSPIIIFLFFTDTTTTEIYTLSLHDALPISVPARGGGSGGDGRGAGRPRQDARALAGTRGPLPRSEEHTSELQSLAYLVCRLLLEKKKKKYRFYFGLLFLSLYICCIIYYLLF